MSNMIVKAEDDFKHGKQYGSWLFAKIGESLYEIECATFSLLWFGDDVQELSRDKKEKIKATVNESMKQLKVLLRYIEKFDVMACEKVCMNCVNIKCGVDDKPTTFDNRCLAFKNKAGDELSSLWETEKTLLEQRQTIDKEIERRFKDDLGKKE